MPRSHSRFAQPARYLGAALLAATIGLSITGCATGGNPTDDARTAVDAFMTALNDRDGEAALDLSTTSIDDVACPGILDETLIAAPEVGDVVVNGSTGIAKVEYVPSLERVPVSLTLELRFTSGEWKIVLPESFRIRTPAPPETVVQADIEEACTLRPVDGYFETIALPGTYSIYLSDPIGLFYRVLGWSSVPQTSPDAGAEYMAGDEFASDVEREITSNLLAVQIQDAMFACIESGFTGTHCPEGLPAADESQDVSRPDDLVTHAVPRSDVFSEDGETWRFESDPLQFRIQVNGALVDVPFTYTGVVTLNNDGDITAQFD